MAYGSKPDSFEKNAIRLRRGGAVAPQRDTSQDVGKKLALNSAGSHLEN
jgi:hypothetical protein